LRRSSTYGGVPKGHCAVYVGESQKKRFVVPESYLSHPLFQDLLTRAEEEFGFDHPISGLAIHCKEDMFVVLLPAVEIMSIWEGCESQSNLHISVVTFRSIWSFETRLKKKVKRTN
ncbi:hypothetical protein MTR67_046503, partial [Solanum verrucosum]